MNIQLLTCTLSYAGSNVTLSFYLTNTGNIRLHNATVVVEGLGPLQCFNTFAGYNMSSVLEVDASMTCRLVLSPTAAHW